MMLMKDFKKQRFKARCNPDYARIQMVAKYWGNTKLGWDIVNPSGRSGGLISVWDPGRFEKIGCIKDSNYLVIKGKLRDCDEIIYVANIYAPQKIRDKKKLWCDLLSLENEEKGMWIMMGDFNAVRTIEDRKGSIFNPVCARDFNEFIFESGLHEYDMKRSRYTFAKEDKGRVKLSKIDRYLVGSEVMDRWPIACLRALPRVFSDHNPILLTVKNLNYGPKPFRFFNSWLDNSDLIEVVENSNETFDYQGQADVKLMMKLKHIRQLVKDWRAESKEKDEEEMERCKKELEEMDTLLDERELSEEEGWIRMECLKNIIDMEEAKAKDLKQKARIKWAIDGDENSRFFHGFINKRKSVNAIQGVQVNGNWVEKPNLVKKHIFEFFRNKFHEDWINRPKMASWAWAVLKSQEADELIKRFTPEEIKAAAFECGDDKAPGPDGFHFRFVKRFWHLLENDFIDMFNEFFVSGKISRGCGSSFITLVPKVQDPVELNDYRPINLIGIINKTISKVLANRIKKVLGSVISPNQTAFLGGRSIIDGPLVLNEIMSWAKKKQRKLFAFKIDFEKAYDNVNWGFLISTMEWMGFPTKWCKWIRGILESARSSILVNGSPTFEFQCQKGMRQGDPIAPFLFIIVMETLSVFFKNALTAGMVKGVEFDKDGTVLSHLLYADDCMIMGEWDEENLKNVAKLLRVFNICSGLKIHLGKSNLFGICVSNNEVEEMARIVHCSAGSFPCKYLGVWIGANMNRLANWNFLFDIFGARLSKWRASSLSMAGRVTIIKSVMECIPTYAFSLFKAPAGVIDGLEKIMRKFLWGSSESGRKIHWVAWEKVASPKDMGGLGISRLKDINIALLSKWLWRYKTEPDSLWRKVITVIHDSKRRWYHIAVNKYIPGTWSTIVKCVEGVKVGDKGISDLFKGVLGDRKEIKFWIDNWWGNGPLLKKYPLLFKLEREKKSMISDKLKLRPNERMYTWNWTSFPEMLDEQRELDLLIKEMDDVSRCSGTDRWVWLGGKDGLLTVKNVKEFLIGDRFSNNGYIFEWCKWVPRKCNLFIWRAAMNRIPTMQALQERNCVAEGTTEMECVLCRDGTETVEHIFCDCFVAARIWQAIHDWCDTPPFFVFDLCDLLGICEQSRKNKKEREALKGIIIIGCWSIWKTRNEIKFDNGSLNTNYIIQSIKSSGYLWYKNRTNHKNISWEDWCKFKVL